MADYATIADAVRAAVLKCEVRSLGDGTTREGVRNYEVAKLFLSDMAEAAYDAVLAAAPETYEPQLIGSGHLGADRPGDVTINVPTALCWLQFRPDCTTGRDPNTRPGVGFALVAYPDSRGAWPNGVIPRDEAARLYQMLGAFLESHPPVAGDAVL